MAGIKLLRTEIPDVFLNERGTQCDKRGIALTFLQLKSADDKHFAQILGAPVTTPAELLKAVALDPMQPLERRLKAAKEAAPYYDQKMPMIVEGAVDTGGGGLDIGKVAALPKKDREALLALLKRVGVTI